MLITTNMKTVLNIGRYKCKFTYRTSHPRRGKEDHEITVSTVLPGEDLAELQLRRWFNEIRFPGERFTSIKLIDSWEDSL